jgi:hypothetical protein
MTDAPETIWAGPSQDDKGVFWDVGHWDADYDEKCIEYTRTDVAQARIAQLEADLATARNNALQEAADACCHPTNAHNGGESAICRNRVLAMIKVPNP